MLQLPKQEVDTMPMMDMNEPQMDDMGMTQDANAMPMDSDMQMQGQQENPYDSNFDAGVEADEESDPKKYIQQLTGKLSQTLHQYNDGLPKPDTDLEKYVLGMIMKQSMNGLSQEDKTEIFDKFKDGNDNGEQEFELEMSDDDDENQNQEDMQQQMGESKQYNLREMFQDIKKNDNIENKVGKSISFKTKPWLSPNFH